jgi:hypothetical protein
LPEFFNGSEDEWLRIGYKRIANDAKRLLLDKKYSEELRIVSDADLELAMQIAFVLDHLASETDRYV